MNNCNICNKEISYWKGETYSNTISGIGGKKYCMGCINKRNKLQLEIDDKLKELFAKGRKNDE